MSSPARPAAVIFDLGNVLLDWNVEAILTGLDVTPAKRELLRGELFEHADWLALDCGTASEAEVVERVCRRAPLAKTTVATALDAARQSLQPIPESLALLRDIAAQGTRLLCLSNMSRENYNHIRNFECFALFDGIVISGLEGCMKPGEAIYRLILERHALRPDRSLFIDDSVANIDTARRLGIGGFHFVRSPACYAELRRLIL